MRLFKRKEVDKLFLQSRLSDMFNMLAKGKRDILNEMDEAVKAQDYDKMIFLFQKSLDLDEFGYYAINKELSNIIDKL
jgi:hypothetical protein